MNNKGFAITGILYTLFVFFMLLIVGSLGALSYKRTTLEKTISGLSDDFLFVTGAEAESIDFKWVIEKNNKYFANFDGKYEFKIIKSGTTTTEKKCVAYLNKGDEITPNSFEGTLIPSDCNTFLESLVDVNNNVYLKFSEENRVISVADDVEPIVIPTNPERSMILTKAYKFRGSE